MSVLCEVGVPVVGESFEVNNKNIGELPEIKLLGGLHKIFALWTVPGDSDRRNEQTQATDQSFSTSQLYWYTLCACICVC